MKDKLHIVMLKLILENVKIALRKDEPRHPLPQEIGMVKVLLTAFENADDLAKERSVEIISGLKVILTDIPKCDAGSAAVLRQSIESTVQKLSP